jgi:glycosyltransferase involved in cell wall biosynthesis
MKILFVMNVREGRGGPLFNIKIRKKNLIQEGFSVDIMSTYGKVRDRIKQIAHIFKLSNSYDIIMGIGSYYYGFLPILTGFVCAQINKKIFLADFRGGYCFIPKFGFFLKIILKDTPIIVASKFLFNAFKRHNLNAILIHHHYNFNDFPKRSVSFCWNKKFMWVGTFEEMYDPETALKACNLVLRVDPDAEFHFFGTGPLLSKLKIKYSNPRIVFEGIIPHNQLLKKYQQFSTMINTSFLDNFPNRFIEAGYNELLVITVSGGGVATVYNKNHCVFINKRDYKHLSESILDVLCNPAKYDVLRKNMNEKILSFTWDKVRDSWLNLLKE